MKETSIKCIYSLHNNILNIKTEVSHFNENPQKFNKTIANKKHKPKQHGQLIFRAAQN